MIRTTQHNTGPVGEGFTLIELLVAMGVASILLLLISQIFFSTTLTVSRGIALSDIMQNVRAFGNQMDVDAQNMVGPYTVSSPSGFLVILNQAMTNVPVADTRQGGEGVATVRSDQLIFFRSTKTAQPGEIVPLVPANDNTYSNTAIAADYARVWYGHIKRLEADGSDPVNDLGQAPAATPDPNRLATGWVLGRQALFLEENDNSSNPNASTYATKEEPSASPTRRLPTYDADVTAGFASGIPAGLPKKLYYGFADVALLMIRDATSTAWSTGTSPGVMVKGLDALTGTHALSMLNGAADGTYKNEAYRYTFGSQRLRCNPEFTTGRIDSWRIAQMHPYMLPRVSEFTVQFAADTDNDGDIQLNGNDIEWFDMDNLPSWSGHAHNPTDLTPQYPSGTALSHADRAFVFRHDNASAWPYLIRIRARIHDRRGELRTGGNQHGFVFEQIIRVRNY